MSRRFDQERAFSRIINRLRLAEGGTVRTSELIEIVYEGRHLGSAGERIRQMAMQLRALGFPVDGMQGNGYRYASSFREVAL